MPQVITFPREFERQFFRDMDREFFLIWVISFLVLAVFFHSMSQREVQALSAEEIQRYTEVIYRVQATPPEPKVTQTTEETTDGDEVAVVEEEPEEVVEEVVEEEPVVEEQPQEPVVAQVSEQEKKEIREEKRERRRSRQDARRQKLREAVAQRTKMLAGPTAKARGGRSTRARAEALGLSSGETEGYDVKKMVGIAGDMQSQEKVKKARGTGAISDDVEDIDISELKDIPLEESNMMFQDSKLDLNRGTITARGRASSSKQRSQAAISEVVMQNKNQVQYCYWTLKRRDSSLRGRVEVNFTIAADGSVTRVRFRRSDWGGNRLGEEVERCIKNVISSWRFEPISEQAGNVTAGATYVFE